jgi:type II restriction enzyme
MSTPDDARRALDNLIRKSRVHFYKPIQIAEILHRHRTGEPINLARPQTYRNISKRWRDEVSLRLVGRSSTSSQKFQDNLFEANAMPPHLLMKLGQLNMDGEIEAHIYRALGERLDSVRAADRYVHEATADSFSILDLVALFEENPGLRRSVDKMYEIAVYALFSAIVAALEARVSLTLGNHDTQILADFAPFIEIVLGIPEGETSVALPAAIYRVGTTNAADRGLDMWSNFGAAVQVKHLTLTPDLVEGIADDIRADRVVIVCRDQEKDAIETLLDQVGWGERIYGIITLHDLDVWYRQCLRDRNRDRLAGNLLADLRREFTAEFPSSTELEPFMRERDYDN